MSSSHPQNKQEKQKSQKPKKQPQKTNKKPKISQIVTKLNDIDVCILSLSSSRHLSPYFVVQYLSTTEWPSVSPRLYKMGAWGGYRTFAALSLVQSWRLHVFVWPGFSFQTGTWM